MSTSTTNGDGSQDIGLMQISQGRLAKDNLSQDLKDAIKKATGKDWTALDVSNPADNIMAGAFHLKYFIGQNGGDVNAGLAAYVGRDPKYVANIQTFRSQLERNAPLSDDAGTPF
jgi:soluble lytic murein transglycosylase-like protein